MRELNAKQKRFANEYIICLNATQSAIKAGYSKKYANTNASKLLQNTTVKAYIDQQLKQLESKKIMNAKEVLERLTLIGRGELSEEIILGTGDKLGKKVSAKEQLKSLELLGKYHSLFTERVDITSDVDIERWYIEDEEAQ